MAVTRASARDAAARPRSSSARCAATTAGAPDMPTVATRRRAGRACRGRTASRRRRSSSPPKTTRAFRCATAATSPRGCPSVPAGREGRRAPVPARRARERRGGHPGVRARALTRPSSRRTAMTAAGRCSSMSRRAIAGCDWWATKAPSRAASQNRAM